MDEKGEKPEVAPNEVVSSQLQTVDLFLRFLVFAASLVAVLVMGTSKETIFPETTKIKYFPALIYFEAALSVAGFYAIITIVVSFMASGQSTPSKMLLFLFAVFDALMIGIVASATGTSAAFGYVGLKGNSHVGWIKVCHVYTKFCRYIAVASAVSLFDSIVLVLLVLISAYSLYRLSSR